MPGTGLSLRGSIGCPRPLNAGPAAAQNAASDSVARSRATKTRVRADCRCGASGCRYLKAAATNPPEQSETYFDQREHDVADLLLGDYHSDLYFEDTL